MATTTKRALALAAFLLSSLPAAAAPEVCVLAPHVSAAPNPPSLPTALIPLSRPTLFIREPLAEIRLERSDTLVWSARAPLASPLEGPLPWPLPPLQPRELLTLRLRPFHAEAGQFASVRLQAATRQRLESGDTLLRSLLTGPPTAWRPAIEGLLAKGDRALATALLFASEGPDDPTLNTLRLQAAQNSCL